MDVDEYESTIGFHKPNNRTETAPADDFRAKGCRRGKHL
jgi:hypothetical protein